MRTFSETFSFIDNDMHRAYTPLKRCWYAARRREVGGSFMAAGMGGRRAASAVRSINLKESHGGLLCF